MISYIRILLIVCLSSLWLASGCDNDPAKGKTQATVSDPAAPNDEQAPSEHDTEGRTYAFTAGESKIEFVGAKVTRKHDGSFGAFSGTITLPGDDPAQGRVAVEIDTASVVVDEPKLTSHIKTPDFFDIEKYPKARFTSTNIRAGGDGDSTHMVTGDLELHGVTKTISFPAKIQVSAERVDVDAEFAIDRKDFGIVYPGLPDDLIKDAVLIRLVTRARLQAPAATE